MTLRGKIGITCIGIVALAAVCIGGIACERMIYLRSAEEAANRTLGNTAGEIAENTMTEQLEQNVLELTVEKGLEADQAFRELANSVSTVASVVTEIYNNADAYNGRDIPLPDAENDGKLAVQLLHSRRIVMEKETIQQEILLLGNAQDTLKSVNENHPDIASNYIATRSGLMIQADYISGSKFDENGNVMPYEAEGRPWYQGAMTNKAVYFTQATRDIHTGRFGVMCGVPFYRGNQVMGISGAGMYLDNVRDAVVKTRIGETGFACIVDHTGRVLFSSAREGVLSIDETVDKQPDLQLNKNNELTDVVKKALNGESGVALVHFADKNQYISYAPMPTVGWSYLVSLDEEEVLAPSREILALIGGTTKKTTEESDRYIREAMILIVAVTAALGLLMLGVSYWLSGQIVSPIRLLTERVQRIDGDNLDFHWDMDTGDETQILARAFGSMTGKMKEYIRNITEITAEKERIGAELSVATQIQADMLPSIFPPFPDRPEFDIYATMTPAKEVGGDFYDFFMIGRDKLAVVIADVSGKGVPAALFMVIAKTLIKSHALNQETPAEVFTGVNAQLCENNKAGLFVTAWMGVLTISTGEFVYVNAGHNAPLLKKKDGDFEYFNSKGFVLAGLEGVRYRQSELLLEPGDVLYLYTDGVTEATSLENELYGDNRLRNVLNRYKDEKPTKILPLVRADIDAFVGEAPQFDDITMLCIKYLRRE